MITIKLTKQLYNVFKDLKKDEIPSRMAPALKLCAEIRKENPHLAKCTSAREISKALFGVAGMGQFIGAYKDDIDKLKAFFGDDHSSLMAWVKHAKIREHAFIWNLETAKPKLAYYVNVDFNPEPKHRSMYKFLLTVFDIKQVVAMTQQRDWADTVIGLTWAKEDKSRWRKYLSRISAMQKRFPQSMWAYFPHDVAVSMMQSAQRAQERKSGVEAHHERTMPEWSAIPAQIGDYKVLVPAHDHDLVRIGRSQHHCVGTRQMGYGDAMRAGEILIVAIYQKTLSDGVCVEIGLPYGRYDAWIKQAQGRHRREPDKAEWEVIDQIIKAVNTHIDSHAA